jgi:hypothetical protein
MKECNYETCVIVNENKKLKFQIQLLEKRIKELEELK